MNNPSQFPFDAIFMLGPQGSGKGTQAKTLSERLGFFFWDTGATLRRNKDVITSSGERARDILKRGQLFTDEELFSVIKGELESIPKDQGIVFDGIPRSIGQAKLIFRFLESRGMRRLATIFVGVPEEESIKRLLLRAEKEGREDDTEESIRKRLEWSRTEVLPTVELLKEHSTFFEIDGSPSIEEVRKDIWEKLGIEE